MKFSRSSIRRFQPQSFAILITTCALFHLLGINAAKAQKAYALLVGLRTYDHSAYSKAYSDAATAGAHLDVEHMKSILSANGYSPADISALEDTDATQVAVLSKLRSLAASMRDDDILILFFSGHGDNIPDLNHDELDGLDEVLVCYDKYLLDDDLYKVWESIERPKRIVMIVDACRSGTTYKIMLDHQVNFNFTEKSIRFAHELNFERSWDVTNAASNSDQGEKFQMIYAGAASDQTDASGSGSGSAFTNGLKGTYDYLNSQGYWKGTRFSQYVKSASSGQPNVSYIEVSCTDDFTKPYPFKIK